MNERIISCFSKYLFRIRVALYKTPILFETFEQMLSICAFQVKFLIYLFIYYFFIYSLFKVDYLHIKIYTYTNISVTKNVAMQKFICMLIKVNYL